MSNDKLAATFHPGASAAPRAHRVIDGDSYHVALDLEPAAVSLIPDMARALKDAGILGHLQILAVVRPSHAAYTLALHEVIDALSVRGALTVQLHPAAAEALSCELWEAKDEPPLTCACGDYTDNADRVCDLCREPGSYARRRSL